MKKIIACLLALSLASCASSDYATLGPGEVQIAGHPYKTAADCTRTAPVGKFDRKCDIPVAGIRGWSPDSSIGWSVGGNGSAPSL